MRIHYCSAVLFVKDVKLSRDFYEKLLNQKPEIDMGVNISFGSFALWQQDHAFEIIHGNPKHQPGWGETFEMCFESPDIEELYEKVKKEGVKLVHELFEQPWAQRVFRFFDPDHNVVEVGEPMDAVIVRLSVSGMTPAEIAHRTGYTEEMVKSIINKV